MHRRGTSSVARALTVCLPVLGLVMAAGAGTASAARTPVNARAAALAALQHLKIGDHETNHIVGYAGGGALKRVRSTNWSGYADTRTSGKYSTATGSWTEPTGACTSATSLAAFWVGIDGYSSHTVEQDGTIAECVSGKPHYFSWWEMYPANAIQIAGRSVKPGDHISASVTRSGPSYTLKLTDSTTPADSFSITRTCASCVDSSSEWIAEAPSGPLTDFGIWTLTDATVTTAGKSGTISSFPSAEITMVDPSSRVMARPGALNAQGNRFSVTWKRGS